MMDTERKDKVNLANDKLSEAFSNIVEELHLNNGDISFVLAAFPVAYLGAMVLVEGRLPAVASKAILLRLGVQVMDNITLVLEEKMDD